MSTSAAVTWTCPACFTPVQVPASVTSTRTPWNPDAVLRVHITETGLADVFAHAWAHEQENDRD